MVERSLASAQKLLMDTQHCQAKGAAWQRRAGRLCVWVRGLGLRGGSGCTWGWGRVVWAGRGHIPKVPGVGPARVYHHSKPRGADSRGASPTRLGPPVGCERASVSLPPHLTRGPPYPTLLSLGSGLPCAPHSFTQQPSARLPPTTCQTDPLRFSRFLLYGADNPAEETDTDK